jgi:hypothetical protein
LNLAKLNIASHKKCTAEKCEAKAFGRKLAASMNESSEDKDKVVKKFHEIDGVNGRKIIRPTEDVDDEAPTDPSALTDSDEKTKKELVDDEASVGGR